jgi:hypothetical protein
LKQILTIKIILEKQKLLLLIGSFHSEITVLSYEEENLQVLSSIQNACSEIKPGISSIDFFYSGILSETFLVTGSFDFRFRLYQKKNHEHKFLGWRSLESIIHQVKFVFHEESETLYLLVASEHKMLFVYIIL